MSAAKDKLVSVSFDNTTAIIHLDGTENRINPDFVAEYNNALDRVIENEDADLLITTSTGKFFSNGVDLAGLSELDGPENVKFWKGFCRLLARIMTFPMPTVAAINGHAFAGGGFLSLAHDYRIMRQDRGWFCFNEIRMPSLFPEFLFELFRHKLLPGILQLDVVVFGKKYTGPEAKEAGIVQEICPLDKLIETAVGKTKTILKEGAFDRNMMHRMKCQLYYPLLTQLDKIGFLEATLSKL